MKLGLSLLFFIVSSLSIMAKGTKFISVNSDTYESMTFNGGWYINSKSNVSVSDFENDLLYVSWIDNCGNIVLGKYNCVNGDVDSHVIANSGRINLSDNPCLLGDNNGNVWVFFTKNDNLGKRKLYFVKKTPDKSIFQVSEPQAITSVDADSDIAVFGSENDGLLKNVNVFITSKQGIDVMTSGDMGYTWSHRTTVFKTQNQTNIQYKIIVDKGYVNVALFDGIGIKMFKSKLNDLRTRNISNLQYIVKGDSLTIWDINLDSNNKSIIAYSDNTQYCFLNEVNDEWKKEVLNAAVCKVKPTKLGGVDFCDDGTFYISVVRNGVCEIEKWQKRKGKYVSIPITENSSKDNMLPVCNSKKCMPDVLWVQNTFFTPSVLNSNNVSSCYQRVLTSIKCNRKNEEINSFTDSDNVKKIMKRVVDWQFANPYDLKRLDDWQWATFYVGLESFYDITKKERYFQEMINIGECERWEPNPKILYVDFLAVISNWLWLYDRTKDYKMIDKAKYALDIHLATRNRYKVDVTFANNRYFDEWWTWCDALFMAPPVFSKAYAVLKEKKYLDYMDMMFWKTTDYLYSKSDSLMFRDDRYFDDLSDNGKKIFWGRGNGWVIGGLARIMKDLPKDYPSRSKYENLYKELSIRLLELQGKDGGWRVSLLDPEYHDEAEMSATALITYGLAWGINNGLLDKKYLPKVVKAWTLLCSNVDESGKLGNVQPEGIDPRGFTPDDWHVYASGAFLSAGCEMYNIFLDK